MGLGEIGLSAQEHMVREAYALDRRRKENDAETERLRTETERLRGIVQRYQDAEAAVIREGNARPTKRAALDAEAASVVELVLRKGAAYGDSYKARTGQLRDTLFENAIRINDKASRLYTLTRAACLGRTIDHGDEAVRDTLRDLAGYALLLLTECAGESDGGEQ